MKKTLILRVFIILIIITMTLALTSCGAEQTDTDVAIDDATDSEMPDSEVQEPTVPDIETAETEEPQDAAPSDPEIPTTDEHLPPAIFPFPFTATDLNGNTVTEEAMGEKRLFFVHLWATWCPPCIEEMPELSEVAIMFEEEVGFIGLLLDFAENPDGAMRAKEESGAPESFINIDARTPELNHLLEILLDSGFIPVTILIDGNGNLIGEPIIGARFIGYADYIKAALSP